MTATLVHAGALSGRPVVTLGGEREALVKDVVFDRGDGHVVGFTLNNPGLLSRSRKDALPWDAVHGFGDAALTITDASVLVPMEQVAPAAERDGADVVAGQVLTDAGTELGTVVDVILDLGARPPRVVGYEIEPGSALPGHGRRVLVPLPATGAVSGERLIVPAAATEFVADDLAAFAVTVQAFRDRIGRRDGESELMRLRETRQREVVDTSTATRVGRVDGAVLALDPVRVHALRLSSARAGPLLSWSDLTAFGPDAVTVSGDGVLRDAADEAEAAAAHADRDLLDKPALSEFGVDLGTVLDAEVDPETGTLLAIVTDHGELDAQRLLGVGSYAAIFRE